MSDTPSSAAAARPAPPFVILAPTAGGAALGRRVRRALAAGGMTRIVLLGRRGRVAEADADGLFDNMLHAVRQQFAVGATVVGVCAAGVLIRAVAPLLADKHREPPVLALAEDGSAIVPLLGGHGRDGRLGANDIARSIASALQRSDHPIAAVTTAGDVVFGIALDDPPPGWTLARSDDARLSTRSITAHVLAGGGVRLEGALPWLRAAGLPEDAAGPAIRGSVAVEMVPEGGLLYHPRAMAIGIGCERGTDPAELIGLVRATLAAEQLAVDSVGLVASLDLKMDEPAVHAVAANLGVPARFFAAGDLEIETPRLANPSDMVFAAVGCHGVAEGAALAAVGPDGSLRVAKRKSARATVAVGLTAGEAPLQPWDVGRARGRLSIVGIGPGWSGWRTPEADRWLAAATDWVGYGLYLDLLGQSAAGKIAHRFPLGEETERVRHALDLAARGRDVALISSGDAGIYAMAALVFELVDRAADSDGGAAWRRVEVAVTPGITAMQAAAARLGAPLGHDFCAISLSDLLTPWAAIERRVRAAAEGDFVVSFYNPVSRRRVTQLSAARDILLDHRPADTPVAICRNLGRNDERVTVTTLGALNAGEVDMLSLVLVGASSSRTMPRGDGGVDFYTPRGYAGKGMC